MKPITIPHGWRAMTLSELGEVNRGRSRHRPRYAEHLYGGKYPFIQTGDVKSSGGRISAYTQTYSDAGLEQSRLWPAGTMCITIAANIAETGILEFAACFPDSIVGFIPDPEKANVHFVQYAFRMLKSQLQHEASGSVQDNINLGTLERSFLAVPAVDQQRAIADVLGALDDKIATNVKLAHTANQLAGHLFDQAASNVATMPMSQVLTPILGGTPTRANSEFWDGDALWASAKDITGASFSVVSTTEEKITQLAVDRTKAKPLPAGSVILTARGTVGAVARLAVPSSFNQSCYGFIPDDIPPGLLYFSVLRAAEHARALAHGSVFDTITKRTFDYLQIPDFGKLGKSTEAQIAPLLDLVTANVMENASLAKTRDTLLPQLMSGKLHVKDAEALVESVV